VGDLGEVLEKVARLEARQLLRSAFEAEVTEFLGRTATSDTPGRHAKAGFRNGFVPFTMKTAAGGSPHPGASDAPATFVTFACRLSAGASPRWTPRVDPDREIRLLSALTRSKEVAPR
jgi:hypothetical protein